MKNFYTEINQPTIDKQQRLFSELFMQAMLENSELRKWTVENWRSVIKKKSDQDFLEFAIEKLEMMSQKHQEKLKRQVQNKSLNHNQINQSKAASQEVRKELI